MRATEAIYAGLFTNEILPLRFGELDRTSLVSRWLSTPFASIVPSILVERSLDAFWLAAATGLATTVVPLPKEFVHAGFALGCIVLFALLFLWLVRRRVEGSRGYGQSSPSRVLRGVSRFASQVASGIRGIGDTRRIVPAALISLAMLTCQVLALWFMLLGCRIDLSFWVGTIVLLIVRLGTAILNAPANVGSTQFFTVLALQLFGVEKTIAAGFSITYFLVLTVPMCAIGLLATSKAGLNLSALRLVNRSGAAL